MFAAVFAAGAALGVLVVGAASCRAQLRTQGGRGCGLLTTADQMRAEVAAAYAGLFFGALAGVSIAAAILRGRAVA